MWTAVTGEGFNLRLSMCPYVFPHDISKIDKARITKFDTEMLHDESWKPTYFMAKRSKVKVTSNKTLPAWVFAIL